MQPYSQKYSSTWLICCQPSLLGSSSTVVQGSCSILVVLLGEILSKGARWYPGESSFFILMKVTIIFDNLDPDD
jgi:hypothetical protein